MGMIIFISQMLECDGENIFNIFMIFNNLIFFFFT